MSLDAAGKSDVGMKRTSNQDSYFISLEHQLFIVADGMGGHRGGEVASALAVQSVTDFFSNLKTSSNPDPILNLKNAVLSANQAIQKKGQSEASLQGMGTTASVVVFRNGSFYVGQVGDSRVYILNQDRIWQITRDHSIVQEKIRAGLITQEQAKSDRMKNVITRSVGFEANLEIDVYEYAPQNDDLFLICSDGLCGVLSDQEIVSVVSEHRKQKKPLQFIVDHLIELANQGGGDDNVTAILVHYRKDPI